ncbi:unnamed protein product, partial [Haemonchus placei]|uniref:SURF1-like protein n=1 Tax=Haemonchus placei TaxID=6290 RepID=A0A0N4WIN9_HAEPC
LDRQEGKEKQSRRNGNSRGDGGNEGHKRPAGSFSMLIIPAVTFGLGCWQTYRLRWKLNLIEKLRERLNEPAVDFPLDELEPFFIPKRHAERTTASMLSNDNLSSHGAHIITPFRLLNSDLVIMINRGWVPISRISPNSRQDSQVKGIVTFEAVVRKSETRPQFMGANIPEKGTWFYKDFDQMARQYGTAPIYLEAVYESTIPRGPIGGQSNVTVRNDHLQYLITWLVCWLPLVSQCLCLSKFKF